MTTLDLSDNLKLGNLDCYTNQLTNLNITKNLNFKTIEYQENKLTSLNVSSNINLIYLTSTIILSESTLLENGITYCTSKIINNCESDRISVTITILEARTANCINFVDELPASDYWFVITRANGIEYKGHFSLKR